MNPGPETAEGRGLAAVTRVKRRKLRPRRCCAWGSCSLPLWASVSSSVQWWERGLVWTLHLPLVTTACLLKWMYDAWVFWLGRKGRKTLAPGLLLGPVMFWAACPAPSPKITYKSKYCFLPFPVPDPFPPPAKGYFLLLTVLTGVEFLRNKCPIQSNAWAGLDGVLGQSAVSGEELEGKEQVRAGGRQGRLRCGGHICWSFRKSPVSCPKRTPVLVSSKNGVTVSLPTSLPTLEFLCFLFKF